MYGLVVGYIGVIFFCILSVLDCTGNMCEQASDTDIAIQ